MNLLKNCQNVQSHIDNNNMYEQLKQELKNIIDNNSSKSNAILSNVQNIDIIRVGRQYSYSEQLPKNLVVSKIPKDTESTNYIILNKDSDCFIRKTVVSFHGSGNILFIGDDSKIGDGQISFYGSEGLVVLNRNNRHQNWFKAWLHSTNSWVYWGEKSTSNGVICVTNDSKGIFVGDDCMFASNTWIRCSDMHHMFDIHSHEIINDGIDVLIDSHVWVAQESLILKGAKIGYGSIIGARSLVTSTIPEFSCAIGSPSKVVKSNVSWYRNKLENIREDTRLLVQEKLNS